MSESTTTSPYIERGMALLDSYFCDGDQTPWWDRIDLARLDLGHCIFCVLGQLFGPGNDSDDGYDRGRRALGVWDRPGHYGFDALSGSWADLTNQWRSAIQARIGEAG